MTPAQPGRRAGMKARLRGRRRLMIELIDDLCPGEFHGTAGIQYGAAMRDNPLPPADVWRPEVHRAGRQAAEDLCEELGLDLAEALAGKPAQIAVTPCARPDTLGEPVAVRSERLRARKVPPTRSGPPQLTVRRGHTRATKL